MSTKKTTTIAIPKKTFTTMPARAPTTNPTPETVAGLTF